MADVSDPVVARIRDPQRLAALDGLGILDTPREAAFDRLARLAARLLDAPGALVNLVDAERQFFKSCLGVPEPWASRREFPLNYGLCVYTVASGEPLLVEDARQHPRYRDNPVVTELGVAAYLGVPLVTANGHAVGAFCAFDIHPRAWTQEDLATLRDLAASAVTEIELRALARAAEQEAVIAASEHRQRVALLESTGEGIYGLDTAGCCTFLNRAGAELLGYQPHEVVGTNMHELVHHTCPDGSPYPVEHCPMFHTLRSGEAVRLEDEVLWRRDGTGFPAEYASHPVHEDGQIVGAVVVFRDITERKRAEDERRKLAAVVEQSSEFIGIATPDGRATYLNEAGRRLVGLEDLAAVRRTRVPDFFFPEDMPLVRDQILPAVLREGRWQGEIRFRHFRTGAPIWVVWNVFAIRDPRTGELLALATASRDITARKESERERADLLAREQAARAAAEAAVRARDELLGLVSHDLKNPLAAIKGYAQLLRRQAASAGDVALGERLAEGIAVIEANSVKMHQMIDDLEDLTRLRSGQALPLRRTPIDLVALARQVLATHAQAGEGYQLCLETSVDGLVGDWDGLWIERVLDNLLGNALKYSPGGGAIIVRVAREEGWAALSVADQGLGIPAADLPRVFERFHRAQNAAGCTTGTGLGLWGAKHILEQHGGTIQVESREAVGTTVTAWLPLEPRPGELPPPPLGEVARLTPRQRQIAALIARGYTNARIAQALALTPGTVANHVEHILQRLGCHNRAQIAAWAVRQGLARPDGHDDSD